MPRDRLLQDLKAMSRRELMLTLQNFSADEREQVLRLIDPPVKSPAAVPFSALAGLSPWLLKAIEPVGEGRATPATRLALGTALERAALREAELKRADKPRSSTFIGRLLASRRRGLAR